MFVSVVAIAFAGLVVNSAAPVVTAHTKSG
jgi:hypothetical protein